MNSIVTMRAGIGHSVRRKEGARLLTGLGRYSDDFNLPAQAYGAVVRSPHAHARIYAINIKAARTIPGVLALLTGAAAAADGLTPIPHLAAPGTSPDVVLYNRDGSAVPVAPHHVLSTDRRWRAPHETSLLLLTAAYRQRSLPNHQPNGARRSEYRTRVPLGLICTPAPTSRKSRACSYSATSKPRCCSASAATSPPMPAPAIRMGLFGMSSSNFVVFDAGSLPAVIPRAK